MLSNVYTKALWDNRRGWVAWAVALALLAAMYASLFPSIAKSGPDLLKAYPENLKEALHIQDLSDPANYLSSSVLGLLVSVLLVVFGIANGVKALAADEEAGTLDLVLAHPVGRVKLALQRIGAVATGVAVIAALVCVTVIAMRGPGQYGAVPPGHVAATCVQLGLLGLVFGSLAFTIGAVSGRRGLSIAVSSGMAVLAYLADSFLPQVKSLKWTQNLSPFHWFQHGEPLKNGLQWTDVSLLLGLSLVLIAVGTYVFTKRDISV